MQLTLGKKPALGFASVRALMVLSAAQQSSASEQINANFGQTFSASSAAAGATH